MYGAATIPDMSEKSELGVPSPTPSGIIVVPIASASCAREMYVLLAMTLSGFTPLAGGVTTALSGDDIGDGLKNLNLNLPSRNSPCAANAIPAIATTTTAAIIAYNVLFFFPIGFWLGVFKRGFLDFRLLSPKSKAFCS